MSINSVHWFRKGLRLHDNPALLEAARGSHTLRCVYFLDPWFAGASNRGVNRWRFLLQCLEDLDSSLRKLNSRLFVIRGQPANIFPRLFKEWKVSRLTFECDSEPFGKERDAAIKKLASEAGVEVIVKTSHTLHDLDRITELNGGQPPLTFKRFQTLVSSMEPPEPPLEPLTRELLGDCVTPVSENHRERYGVPLLDELGESEALKRLERHFGPDSNTAWQENFERPKMSSSPLLASPLGLSPYLRFGCLSCRLFYYKLTELYNKVRHCIADKHQFIASHLYIIYLQTHLKYNLINKRYLPMLRDFPTKFIYDPWNAPDDVQRAAKCVIGVDYPKPMVNHAEASRLNIERMRQIYQQLSRYRGLSLLATVPSNHMEVVGVSEAQAAPPTRRRTQSSTSSQRVRREQPGPSGAKHRSARHRHALSHRTSPYTPQSDLTERGHEFAVPQQPGRLIWPVGGGTGRREREEAELNGCHGDDGPSSSSSALKLQDDEKRQEDAGGVAFSS
uniref:Cryptochrome circadian regulator 3b n=1 Tax=Cyprinus carpio TaxID=7962 RepID=A0A8C1P5E7_CYPCA